MGKIICLVSDAVVSINVWTEYEASVSFLRVGQEKAASIYGEVSWKLSQQTEYALTLLSRTAPHDTVAQLRPIECPRGYYSVESRDPEFTLDVFENDLACCPSKR